MTLVEANGSGVSGSIRLTQNLGVIIITGSILGLSTGLHGFHIHTTGATGNNCADAGGHFNPSGVGPTFMID